MHSPFDILKKKPEGSFRWFEAASDLESTNIRIEELIVLSPGECVVFDQRAHNVIAAGGSSFWVDARREWPPLRGSNRSET
jgi:hypothetical protein